MRCLAVLFGVLILPCRAAAQEADPPLEPYSGGPIVVTTVAVDPGSASSVPPPTGATATPGTGTTAGDSTTAVDSTVPPAASPGPTTGSASSEPVPATAAVGPSVTSGSEGEAARATSTTLTAAPEADPPGAAGALWIALGVLALGIVAAAVGIVRVRRARARTIAD